MSRGFHAELTFFGVKTAAQVERIRRGVIISLFNSVILDTPVDTGRLRNNWRVSVGKPITTAKPEAKEYEKSGRLVMREIENAANESRGDTEVWLSNNLPYAPRIEFEGWSHTKAPEGMVRKNVARFNRLVDLEAQKNR